MSDFSPGLTDNPTAYPNSTVQQSCHSYGMPPQAYVHIQLRSPKGQNSDSCRPAALLAVMRDNMQAACSQWLTPAVISTPGG